MFLPSTSPPGHSLNPVGICRQCVPLLLQVWPKNFIFFKLLRGDHASENFEGTLAEGSGILEPFRCSYDGLRHLLGNELEKL
jgi:hypothetical protein